MALAWPLPRAARRRRRAPDPVRAGSGAAASITAPDVARRVGILADDSMMGRDTPSRGLELTAKYVADEFRRFGLKPGGDNGTWFQRYPITRRRLQPRSRAWCSRRAGNRDRRARPTARVRQRRHAREAGGGARDSGRRPGHPDAVGAMELRDKVVLYVPDYRSTIPARMPVRSPARSG